MSIQHLLDEAQNQHIKCQKLTEQRDAAAEVTDAGAATYTAAQVVGGLILRDCAGGARIDVLPTATLLVAALDKPKIGDIVRCLVINNSDAAEEITITAGTDGTVPQVDATQVIPQNTSRMLHIRITGVTTPAYVVYM